MTAARTLRTNLGILATDDGFLTGRAPCEFAYMYNMTAIITLQTPLEKEFNLNDFGYGQILTFKNFPSKYMSER